jgi:hypothetical protein
MKLGLYFTVKRTIIIYDIWFELNKYLGYPKKLNDMGIK